ncbi:biotin--[acetyl-CoA-carboxylase] ligase [Paracoccus sp. 1_MG-2023]|uniref:biotin--[acetyl-CoA-carboxylase] ligase n=1 Tax=unclassified Paracoccus (in: a-proteobacteria) TaxID=2688777 RepID=UPI001C087D72|nr:biotin--[acetyl-CoA-carboxylase] ligase [Paracoccus sp. 1_MG-2023]MBU2958230.1 biotin--[acetyl-CoA-carboxylase] ligase [Paracoccus sp. C2R09]MDO6668357.1 biotin--[acetyl-CoA-carboxylase] ligase [Paracoccus sp. 1_MG-2023]
MSEASTEAWPEGVARHVLDRVDSTNAEAFRRAADLTGPAWIMAYRQEAGRGRRGRAWRDPQGNFAATLVMRPQGGLGDAARLSFVAALAVHDALRAVCGPQPNFALKWPNDVLLNGGKLSGILLESTGTGGNLGLLAVGIGINLTEAPAPADVEAGAMRPVSLLAETGMAVTPDEMLDALAPAFDGWHRQLLAYGFGPIRNAWMARAAKLGETIVARTGNAEFTGRFDGIDDTGALILTGPRGRHAIPAADIHFGG